LVISSFYWLFLWPARPKGSRGILDNVSVCGFSVYGVIHNTRPLQRNNDCQRASVCAISYSERESITRHRVSTMVLDTPEHQSPFDDGECNQAK